MKSWSHEEERVLRERLSALAEEDYRNFHAALMPNVPKERVLGIRTPVLRSFAGVFAEEGRREAFLKSLPHFYYEENNLHAFLIAGIENMKETLAAVDAFLPFVDNWATCDSLRPKVFARDPLALLPWVEKWLESPHPYTCRFGIEMLMVHFLGENFSPWMPERIAAIRSEEYYVNMMIAWYFATALAFQEERILPFLEGDALSPWCRRKAIGKARESRRIPEDTKKHLSQLTKKHFEM